MPCRHNHAEYTYRSSDREGGSVIAIRRVRASVDALATLDTRYDLPARASLLAACQPRPLWAASTLRRRRFANLGSFETGPGAAVAVAKFPHPVASAEVEPALQEGFGSESGRSVIRRRRSMTTTHKRGQTRREWLRAAGTAGLGLYGASCHKHPTPTPDGPSVPAHRSASIPSIVAYNNIDSQRCLEWCWAACAETIVRQFDINVNNINGVSVAQEYFAAKIYGSIAPNTCQPAYPAQMATALTDTYMLNGSTGRISLQGYSYFQAIPLSFNTTAVRLIQAQVPWSVLLQRLTDGIAHFLTVYEMEWTEDGSGNVQSVNAYSMADPAQFLYQFLGVEPFPKRWVGDPSYVQLGVVWAERVG